MNAKTIAICSVFAAVSIILIRVRVPTFYWPGTYYFWEIPIIAALLLFGLKCGVFVAVLTAVAQPIVSPNPLGLLFPVWNFIAMSTVMIGVYLGYRMVTRKGSQTETWKTKYTVYFTSLGVALRVGIMPFVDYAMYRTLVPLVLGQNYSDAYIMALMPGIVVYNVVVPLYTIPTGYLLAKIVSKNLKIGNKLY